MTKIKLTKTTVEKLPYADKGKQVDYFDSDLDGFGVRVSHTGKKYFVRRLIGKKRVRVMIGSHPIKAAEDARSEAKIKLGLMESGTDPNEQTRVQNRIKEIEAQRLTVKELVKEYIERHAMTFKRSWEADERLLNKEIVQVWGKRKASDITKRDITLLLESIVDRGTPAMSNQVLKITRKMFNFAVERDILQHTPFTGVKALAPNVSRERTLTETEIRTLWGSVNAAVMSDDIRRSLKLVLLTAQRPGEVSGMHTKEINGHWWTIPAERSKNGKEHRVYLTVTVLDIINAAIEDIQQGLIKHNMRMKKENKKEVPITYPYSGYIFPTPHRAKNQPIDSHALPVAVRRNLAWPLTDKNGNPLYNKAGKPVTENKLNVDQFTPHDLRRTAATFMAGMGYMDEIIDAVLNHVKQGIIRTYNRHDYDKEKQQALEAWERKINGIISTKESNVIPIGRRAA